MGFRIKLFLRTWILPPGILVVWVWLNSLSERWRYTGFRQKGYDEKRYWQDRHKQYGESLRGVGFKGMDELENMAWYLNGKYIFQALLAQLNLSTSTSILEIGFGTGFYTQLLVERGIGSYLGVDIVDQHHDKLQNILSGTSSELLVADIGKENIKSFSADLVTMLDVSQHIVNDKDLIFCLKQVDACLESGGFFMVTDSDETFRESFYVCGRSFDFYKTNLSNYRVFHQKVRFRDKYALVLQKK